MSSSSDISTVAMLTVDSVSKCFRSSSVVDSVSLTIRKGEIFALVGQNGAGKSTIVGMLAGLLQPDSGSMALFGEKVTFKNPGDSLKKGIGVIYQESKLVESMTVAENILLARRAPLFSRKKALLKKINELACRFNIKVPLTREVATLSISEKQQVEILRLLYQETELLIFDEASSLLSGEEKKVFQVILRKLIEADKAVIFVSHDLIEVKELADRICILREGRIEKIVRSDEISIRELAKEIIGDVQSFDLDKKRIKKTQTLLSVRSLFADGLKDVTFSLKQGEIFSIVGLAGNGQKEIVEVLANRRSFHAGSCILLGKGLTEFYCSSELSEMLSYIPEDKYRLATGKELDLLETFLLTTRKNFTDGVWLAKDEAREKAEKLMADFRIRAESTEMLVDELSGGNLQKLILARTFFKRPKIIMVEHPTQGLDVQAKKEIWQLLLNAREQTGVLLVTADLSEAVSLSDRVGVMVAGRMVQIVEPDSKEGVENISKILTSGISH